MRALIADTDAGRRAALHAELQRHGYEIAEATVAEAPERARALDALLVCLGGEGALDACRALRDRARIVILLGDVSPLDGIAAGATDVWPVTNGLDTRIALAQHFARLQAENVRVGGEFALLRRALDLDRHRLRAHRPAARGSPDRLRQPLVPGHDAATRRTRCSAATAASCRARTPTRPVDELRRAIARAAAGDGRAAQLPARRQRVLERGPHLAGARRARRGRALRRACRSTSPPTASTSGSSCASRPPARRPSSPSGARRSWPRRAHCSTPRSTCARRSTR